MALHPAKWALIFVRLRWYFLSFATVVTLIAGVAATRLTFNFSPDNIYLATDPAYQFYVSRFLQEFGQSANVCIIAIEGDLKTLEVQNALGDLHKEVSKIEEVENVRSLINTSVFRQIDGNLQQQPIFNDQGKTNNEILDWAAGDPAMQNLLISEKADVATVTVRLPLKLADQNATDEISFKLKAAIAKVAERYPQLRFHLAGTPILQEEAISTLKKDQLRFLPIVVILMALLLWLSFHSVRGVLLPFLATGTAALWAMGWLVLMGHPLDIINNKL